MNTRYYKSMCKPARRLALESLEPRMMLDADALLWGGDAHVSLSFAPDGTKIAGSDSTLFASMNAIAPQVEWQEAILRAFQTWAARTNGGIGVVPDGGQDFGVAGASRSDPRFGDVRIGAAPLAPGAFAVAIPATDVLSGTWVGDVIFNSQATFSSVSDVFAVALHEAGHVFGLAHSPDPASPMHVHGITPVTDLTAGDIADLQTLHGAPSPDINELSKVNDSQANATHLNLNHAGLLPDGSAPSVIYGTVTSVGDADYFRIVTPLTYQGPPTFTVRRAGVSLLAPKLTIFDADGTQIDQVASTNVGGDQLSVTLPNVLPDHRYYALVEGGRSDIFGVGDYSLVTKFDDLNAVDQATIDGAAGGALRFLPQDEIAKVFSAGVGEEPSFNDDDHADDSLNTRVDLSSAPGFALRTRYEVIGSIADSADIDFYRVQSPAAAGNVMTIRVHSLESPGLVPAVSAYDASRNPLAARILANGGGEYVVQLDGVPANSQITFSVAAADPIGPFNSGNYQLTVGFGSTAISLASAASGALTPAAPVQAHTLYVSLPQLFHFVLDVPPAAGAGSAAVLATIYDADHQVVFRIAARPGETRSANSVLLKPGTYTAQFVGIDAGGLLSSDLQYALEAGVSSDPFVGNPDDPTFQPEFQCTDPSLAGFFCYPGNFISTDPFLWSDFLNTLPGPPPTLSQADLIGFLLGDWWKWVWQQTGSNGPPLAQNDIMRVTSTPLTANGAAAAVAPMNVLANDIDPENSPMVAVLHSSTTHGSLTLNADGTFDYSPNAGFAGVDTFTYAAFDFVNESAVATVRISVGLRGDYDGDRDVDGSDFLKWQRALGDPAAPPGSGADGDGNGTVDTADVLAWRDNFAASTPLTVLAADYDRDADVDGADFLVWQQQLGSAVSSPGSGADGDQSGTVDGPDLTLWTSSVGAVSLAAAGATQATTTFSAALKAAPTAVAKLPSGTTTIDVSALSLGGWASASNRVLPRPAFLGSRRALASNMETSQRPSSNSVFAVDSRAVKPAVRQYDRLREPERLARHSAFDDWGFDADQSVVSENKLFGARRLSSVGRS